MTDLEISKALALAIRHHPSNIAVDTDAVRIYVGLDENNFRVWRTFDYRDWNAIGPIAEKYNYFPWQSSNGKWYSIAGPADEYIKGQDTPQKAIALAVIEGAEK